jgi:pimeloyl-ACP methyl ester carboxylesterase
VYWDHFTKPILAIYGQNDGLSFTKSQVNRFKQAMAAAHNRHATIHVLPGVGHSMKVQRTGSMADEYTFLRYSLEYFRIMTNWIERITTDERKPR